MRMPPTNRQLTLVSRSKMAGIPDARQRNTRQAITDWMVSFPWLRYSPAPSALASATWLWLPIRSSLVGIARPVSSSTDGTDEEMLSLAWPALLRTLRACAARCVSDVIYPWGIRSDDKMIVLPIDFQTRFFALDPLPSAVK